MPESVPQLITAPSVEPISTAEAKAHLRIEHTDDDSYIDALITAARQAAENYTGRRLITQTWDATFAEFQDEMLLPGTPLQSISSVTYLDSDGDSQTLGTGIYEADTTTEPGALRRTYLQVFPVTRPVWNAVVVRYVAGYGDAGSDVPAAIRQALLIHIAHMYEFREEAVTGTTVAVVPMAYRALLHPYRLWK